MISLPVRTRPMSMHMARAVPPYCVRSIAPYLRGLFKLCMMPNRGNHHHLCRAFKDRTFVVSMSPWGGVRERSSFDRMVLVLNIQTRTLTE